MTLMPIYRGKKWIPEGITPIKGQRFYKSLTPSVNGHNGSSTVSDGTQEFPMGNAYCLVPIGNNLMWREYLRRFPKGVTVHIDQTETVAVSPKGVTGRELLQRFYELQPRPTSFTLQKKRNKLDTSRWVVVYPMHYMVIIEISDKAGFADDHECTLYYVNTIHRVAPGRDRSELIPIAHQLYEGYFLQGQPDDMRGELKEWREKRLFFQDAIHRDAIHDI